MGGAGMMGGGMMDPYGGAGMMASQGGYVPGSMGMDQAMIMGAGDPSTAMYGGYPGGMMYNGSMYDGMPGMGGPFRQSMPTAAAMYSPVMSFSVTDHSLMRGTAQVSLGPRVVTEAQTWCIRPFCLPPENPPLSALL